MVCTLAITNVVAYNVDAQQFDPSRPKDSSPPHATAARRTSTADDNSLPPSAYYRRSPRSHRVVIA